MIYIDIDVRFHNFHQTCSRAVKAHIFGSGFVVSFSPRCIFENFKANHITTVEFLILHLWIFFQMPKYLGSDTIFGVGNQTALTCADEPARSSSKQQTNSQGMPRGIALKEIGAWYEAPFLFLRTKHGRKPWNNCKGYRENADKSNLRPLQSNMTKSKLPGFLHYLPRTSHLPFHPYTDKCLKIIARVLGKKSQKCQGSLSNHPDSYNFYHCHMSLTDPKRPDHFKRSCMMFPLVSGDQGWVAWILNIWLGGFMSHLGQHARQKHLHCLVPPIDFHHLKEDHVISLYNVQGD